jgi:hypothetical protein
MVQPSQYNYDRFSRSLLIEDLGRMLWDVVVPGEPAPDFDLSSPPTGIACA